jgi:hypothetical protein
VQFIKHFLAFERPHRIYALVIPVVLAQSIRLRIVFIVTYLGSDDLHRLYIFLLHHCGILVFHTLRIVYLLLEVNYCFAHALFVVEVLAQLFFV